LLLVLLESIPEPILVFITHVMTLKQHPRTRASHLDSDNQASSTMASASRRLSGIDQGTDGHPRSGRALPNRLTHQDEMASIQALPSAS